MSKDQHKITLTRQSLVKVNEALNKLMDACGLQFSNYRDLIGLKIDIENHVEHTNKLINKINSLLGETQDGQLVIPAKKIPDYNEKMKALYEEEVGIEVPLLDMVDIEHTLDVIPTDKLSLNDLVPLFKHKVII